jgi:integrase
VFTIDEPPERAVMMPCGWFDDVAAWIAALVHEGLSASWVRQIHRTASMLFDVAVKSRRITVNPAHGVDLPRLPRSDKAFLTHEQLADLADACGDYRTFVLTLGYTGVRFGEAAALRKNSVDVLRGRLHIAEAMTEVGGKVVFGAPKTHRQRSVPFPRFLREALAEQCAGKDPDDFVFPAPRGGVLRDRNFRRHVFDNAAEEVGLDVTPKALRDTAASLAISAGANVKAVQAMLGHASAAVTLDIYSHLFGDDLDAVADRLDAAAEMSRTSRGLQPKPKSTRRRLRAV